MAGIEALPKFSVSFVWVFLQSEIGLVSNWLTIVCLSQGRAMIYYSWVGKCCGARSILTCGEWLRLGHVCCIGEFLIFIPTYTHCRLMVSLLFIIVLWVRLVCVWLMPSYSQCIVQVVYWSGGVCGGLSAFFMVSNVLVLSFIYITENISLLLDSTLMVTCLKAL